MSYPGSPGDPAGQQPGPTPGGFEYPPIDYGTQPPVYSAGYSQPPQVPPGAYPPPPGAYPPPEAYPPPHAYPPQGQYPPPQYGGYGQYPNQYPQYPGSYGPPPTATNGMAIGSLVSSLVGLPLMFFCFGIVGSIAGIILGIVALNQVKSTGQKGREMAIAGIVIGIVGVVLLVLFYVVGFTLLR